MEEVAQIEKIEVYFPSLVNSMYQHCNDTAITVGGSAGKGNGSAIHISNYFKDGMCFANCETYESHPQLSSKSHFKVKRFEVWALSDL